MTNGRLNNHKQRVFGSWKVPPSASSQINKKVLFIDKINVLPVTWVRSIVAFYARSQIVRSSARNRSKPMVQALKRWLGKHENAG